MNMNVVKDQHVSLSTKDSLDPRIAKELEKEDTSIVIVDECQIWCMDRSIPRKFSTPSLTVEITNSSLKGTNVERALVNACR